MVMKAAEMNLLLIVSGWSLSRFDLQTCKIFHPKKQYNKLNFYIQTGYIGEAEKERSPSRNQHRMICLVEPHIFWLIKGTLQLCSLETHLKTFKVENTDVATRILNIFLNECKISAVVLRLEYFQISSSCRLLHFGGNMYLLSRIFIMIIINTKHGQRYIFKT